jgi:hypothetical protein
MFHQTTMTGRVNATYHAIYSSIDNGAQERPHQFSIFQMGNRVGERNFAKDFYIVPGCMTALSMITSCLTFQAQVAFLMDHGCESEWKHQP